SSTEKMPRQLSGLALLSSMPLCNARAGGLATALATHGRRRHNSAKIGPNTPLTHGASMQDRPRTPPNLFSPIAVGPLKLPNRVVMAPLTRSRAARGNVPTLLNALYYAQRASAGLIISEATQIMAEGQGYISTPGIHSAEQIKGWQCVTGAVHACGGHIV